MTKPVVQHPIYGAQVADLVVAAQYFKIIEEALLRALDELDVEGVDPRWFAIGRTQIEQGFMAITRAIFKPERMKFPGDTVEGPSEPASSV